MPKPSTNPLIPTRNSATNRRSTAAMKTSALVPTLAQLTATKARVKGTRPAASRPTSKKATAVALCVIAPNTTPHIADSGLLATSFAAILRKRRLATACRPVLTMLSPRKKKARPAKNVAEHNVGLAADNCTRCGNAQKCPMAPGKSSATGSKSPRPAISNN